MDRFFPINEKEAENMMSDETDSIQSLELRVMKDELAKINKEEKCLFCNNPNHNSPNCTLMKKGGQRMAFVRKNRLCMNCLKPTDAHGFQRSCIRERCVICNKEHNTMLCNMSASRFCFFCKSGDHSFKKCQKFFIDVSVADRRTMLEKENRCLYCFKGKFVGNHDWCESQGLCHYCMKKHNDPKRAVHHKYLCLKRKNNHFQSISRKISESLVNPVTEHLPITPADVEQEDAENCLFCNSLDHSSVNCTVIERGIDRMNLVKDKQLCKRCLKPIGHDGTHHPCTTEKCTICYKNHNTMLCSKIQYNVQPAETCLFCKSLDHSSAYCTVIDRKDHKIAFISKNRLCKRCLKSTDANGSHECTTEKCAVCNSIKHNTMLCTMIEHRICSFCKSRYHFFKECPKYFIGVSVADRRQMLEKEDRCLNCFKENRVGNHKSCRNQNLCRTCLNKYKNPKRAVHHKFLCLEQENDSSSQIKNVKERQPISQEATEHLVIPDTNHLPITHVEQECVEKCLFCKNPDHNSANCTLIKRGSQRMAFVTRNRLCKICLKPTDANGFHECTAVKCAICNSIKHHTMLCAINENRLCQFCNSRDHSLKECPKYFIGVSVTDRRAMLEKENRCLYCFKGKFVGNHKPCRGQSLCHICKKKYRDVEKAVHHKLLCLKQDLRPLLETKNVGKQQPISQEGSEHPGIPDPKHLLITPAHVKQEDGAKCLFCKSLEHSSGNCTVLERGIDRMNFLKKNRFCERCLKPTDANGFHECTMEECAICNSIKHNTMLCTMVESRYCQFCKSRGGHNIKKCPKYFIGVSVADRKAMFEKEDRCLYCFKENRFGDHDLCRTQNVCKICMKKYYDVKRAFHHKLLCPEQQIDSSSENVKEQPISQETSASLVIPDTNHLPITSAYVEQEGVEKCLFCKSSVHNSANCTLIKCGTHRMAFVTTNRLCKICLKPTDANGFHKLCTMNSCNICYNKHNSILCGFIENRHCAFCHSRDHYYQGCPQYLIGISVADRKARLEKEKRCLYCFKRNRAGHHDLCQKRSLCRTCMKKYNDPKRAAHHRFLCLETGDIKKCLFCDIHYHLTANCSLTQLERKASFVRKNFCMKCLKPINKATHTDSMICKEKVEKCTKCNSSQHNKMFCTAL